MLISAPLVNAIAAAFPQFLGTESSDFKANDFIGFPMKILSFVSDFCDQRRLCCIASRQFAVVSDLREDCNTTFDAPFKRS